MAKNKEKSQSSSILDLDAVKEMGGAPYPDPFRGPWDKKRRKPLGDPLGLTKFGVNLTVLEPGAQGGMAHWHENEDELVYVLEGELTLTTEEGRWTLGPGDVCGFRAGDDLHHEIKNESDKPVTIIEIGSRPARDKVHYKDRDLVMEKDLPRLVFKSLSGNILAERTMPSAKK